MELRGIRLDVEQVKRDWATTEADLIKFDNQIREQWGLHFEAWAAEQRLAVSRERAVARASLKRQTPKILANHDESTNRMLAQPFAFNINSPTQLRWLLTERLGLDARNLDGDDSTDKETLNRLALENDEVAVLLKYRKAKKLVTTYYPEYLDFAVGDRIHATFRSTGTRTGRISCSQPNLQNVPGALHSLFTADPGKMLVTRDLSAIEPTVLAYYSEDPRLCELMLNGGDFHGTNAHAMFDLDCNIDDVKHLHPRERKVAKECGLAVLYGAGAFRIHQVLQKYGLSEYTEADAKRFVYRIRDLYEGVWRFKQLIDKDLDQGKTLFNFMGRPFKIHNRDDVYMKGLNTLIQGSASDIMQEGALRVARAGFDPLLIVHDELVVQVPEASAVTAERKIIECLTSFKLTTAFGDISIRTEGKISKCWEK
jgi:DNA polymerase-1